MRLQQLKRSKIVFFFPHQDPSFNRDAHSGLVTSVRLSPSNPVTLFRFVQGAYSLRLSECRLQACVPVTCSRVKTFRADVPKEGEVCAQGPAAASAVLPRYGQTKYLAH